MNTLRAKIIVLTIFVLTLGAGVTAGILASRLPGTPIQPTAPAVFVGESPLTTELGLSPDQSEKMQRIWEGVRDISAESLTKGNAALHARDDAIRALISPDKIDEYNAAQRKYSETIAAMKGRRESAFNHAVGQTNEILTESQRKKYAEILAKRLGAEQTSEHDPLTVPAGERPASQPSL